MYSNGSPKERPIGCKSFQPDITHRAQVSQGGPPKTVYPPFKISKDITPLIHFPFECKSCPERPNSSLNQHRFGIENSLDYSLLSNKHCISH